MSGIGSKLARVERVAAGVIPPTDRVIQLRWPEQLSEESDAGEVFSEPVSCVVLDWGDEELNMSIGSRVAKIEQRLDKEAERALRESEARYRELVETMNEGMTIVDEKKIRTYANRRLSEMLGYAVYEIIGVSATKPLDVHTTMIWEEKF